MIFNINSTRGHTGSLLVVIMIMDVLACVINLWCTLFADRVVYHQQRGGRKVIGNLSICKHWRGITLLSTVHHQQSIQQSDPKQNIYIYIYIKPSTQCYAKNRPDSGKEYLAENKIIHPTTDSRTKPAM